MEDDLSCSCWGVSVQTVVLLVRWVVTGVISADDETTTLIERMSV
jgi:hypothetical protein